MGFFERLWNVEIQEPFVPTLEERSIIPPSRNEIVVNESTALTLVPVSRSISILETAVQQIPVDVYRGKDKIDSPSWLTTPDIENNISQSELIGQTVVSLATFGNAFWKISRGTRGIVNIEIVDPSLVTVTRDNNGKIVYTYFGKVYSNSEMIHIKLWKKLGYYDLLGEGPIQRHSSVLQSALDLQNYSDNWFKSAAVPTGALTTTEFLSEDVAKSNKQAFIESQKQRSVAVLSSGLKYEAISLKPEEAQFLENQKFVARQIASMFGIPSIYLGLSVEGQGLTYTNGNEDRNKLYEDGLQQYLIRIEQALTDLLPRGQEAKFNLTNFLRPDQLVRYQAYAIGIDKGFLSVDEIRNFESLA